MSPVQILIKKKRLGLGLKALRRDAWRLIPDAVKVYAEYKKCQGFKFPQDFKVKFTNLDIQLQRKRLSPPVSTSFDPILDLTKLKAYTFRKFVAWDVAYMRPLVNRAPTYLEQITNLLNF